MADLSIPAPTMEMKRDWTNEVIKKTKHITH